MPVQPAAVAAWVEQVTMQSLGVVLGLVDGVWAVLELEDWAATKPTVRAKTARVEKRNMVW
jgi:hypothetical protein